MKKVMIFGATSAIAEATARHFAAAGDRLYLVARSQEKLDAIAADLRIRGADRVAICVMEATEYERHESLIEQAVQGLGGLDSALVAHGTLPDQRACERSFEITRAELEVNFLSTISLLTHLANHFERESGGTLAAISSVAGDRGRQSNYVYGAAKGGVSIFLDGLRNRLQTAGVRVITIKPGFVDTPMTAEFDKGALWAQPDKIAHRIYTSMERGADVLYVPWFWKPIMFVIKHIPEPVFKRMKL